MDDVALWGVTPELIAARERAHLRVLAAALGWSVAYLQTFAAAHDHGRTAARAHGPSPDYKLSDWRPTEAGR